MFGFDKMFDLNRDGQISNSERALQYHFLEEMSREEERERSRSIWDDDEEDDDEY